MKGVSLRAVNFTVWSHLGCSGQNAIVFRREGLVQGCTRENIKIYIYCLCFNMVSFQQGSKKAWATPRSVSFRGLIQNFRRASPPLSYAESPRALAFPQTSFGVRSSRIHFSPTDRGGGQVHFSLYLKTKAFVCSQAFIKMTCVRQQNNAICIYWPSNLNYIEYWPSLSHNKNCSILKKHSEK